MIFINVACAKQRYAFESWKSDIPEWSIARFGIVIRCGRKTGVLDEVGIELSPAWLDVGEYLWAIGRKGTS